MARIPLAWPFGSRYLYQEIYNECLRVEAMLETCLAEYEVDNPWLFEPLLPRVAMRIRHVNQAALATHQYAPEGRGKLPKWFHVAEKICRISQIIADVLDSVEMQRQIKEHRWQQVSRDAKSIIQASQYIREILTSVPLENSRIVMTISGFREVVLNERR